MLTPVLNLIFIPLMINSLVLFDFNDTSILRNWYIVDDVVMGGRSNGSLRINDEGFGEFSGFVSLENNGGFSSARYVFNTLSVEEYNQINIRLKGDGKKYQFRVRHHRNSYYSYITYFSTTTKWETITIDLEDLYPSFRGRTLNKPNFDKNQIVEIAFLIGNKKPEEFKLLIDKITLK